MSQLAATNQSTTNGSFSTSTNGGTILASVLAASATSPTAGQVQTYLSKISALAGNFTVFGPDGGPFTIVYTGNLAFTDASQLNLTTQPTGGTAPVTTENGLSPNPASGNEIQTLVFSGTPTARSR